MEESKRKIEKYMQEATERMNANDLDSAAFKVRKALEVLVKELCNEMEIDIKVKGKDRDSLNAILGKIKETNAETRVLKYDDIESMYKVKQVGNIGSHDDDEKHLEKATGEVKVRNAIDTMYLLLESLTDNNKLKLTVSVNAMLEDAKKEQTTDKDNKQNEKDRTQAESLQTTERQIVKPKAGKTRPINTAEKVAKVEKKEKPHKQKSSNGSAGAVFKSIIKWDVLIAIITAIIYFVGGIKYALYIGVAAGVLVDFLLIASARKNPGKKPLHRVVFIVVAALLIALSGAGSYFVSPANAATRALNNGDSDSAKAIILQKIEGNAVQEAIFNRSVENYYKKTVDEYSSDSISDNEVKNKLSVLGDVLNTDTGKKAAAFIKSIDAYNQGKTFYDNKNYTDAILMLSQVSRDFPKYNEAREMISSSKQTYKDDLFKKIGAPATLEECVNALELLKEATAALPDEKDIILKQEEVSNLYLALLKEEVNKRLSEYDYDGASELVSTARELIGEKEELGSLTTMIIESKPIPLKDLLPEINAEELSKPTENSFETLDSLGNEYSKDNTFMLKSNAFHDEDAYVIFNVGENSKRLKGTIACQHEDTHNQFKATVIIETTEEKRYTLDREHKIDIDTSLAGTDRVKITVINNNKDKLSSNGKVLLGDFYVYK